MQKQMKNELERWLQGFRWDYWCTPTFCYEKTQPEAMLAVRQWLSNKPDAYAAVAYELGPGGGRVHCHAVIGGVGRDAKQRTHLSVSWRRGIITVEQFDPTRRGIRYLLDRANDPDGLELLGTPQSFRARRRGRRGK